MWRCPRCVTEVGDDQTCCPSCRHGRPEQMTGRVDLPPAVAPEARPLPAPAAPDIERRRSVFRVAPLLIGFIGFCLVRLLAAFTTPGGVNAFLANRKAELVLTFICAGVTGVLALLGWAGFQLAWRIYLDGDDPPDEKQFAVLDERRGETKPAGRTGQPKQGIRAAQPHLNETAWTQADDVPPPEGNVTSPVEGEDSDWE
jgi:hypothetical protein